MADIITYDFVNEIYSAWVTYMQSNSSAKYFGMSADYTRIAKFPFANLQLLGKAQAESNLENDEVTARVSFQSMCFINSEKMSILYGMDDASTQFFQNIGFHRMGESVPIRVSDSVNAIASRFTCDNFNGVTGLENDEPGT